MNTIENKHLNLFFTMMKIGIFTFGGGYAMIALLQNEFVMKKKWITEKEFMDMIAISESTPGPLAINCATYIGYKIGGIMASLACTVGVVIPSFVIICLISLFFDQFLSFEYVAHAFKGIQVCVVYLIASAGFQLLKGMEKNLFSICIMFAVLMTMIILSITAVKVSSIIYILMGGILGFVFYLTKARKEGRNLKI